MGDPFGQYSYLLCRRLCESVYVRERTITAKIKILGLIFIQLISNFRQLQLEILAYSCLSGDIHYKWGERSSQCHYLRPVHCVQPWLIFSAIDGNTQKFSHLSALFLKSSVLWSYRAMPACLLWAVTIHGNILCSGICVILTSLPVPMHHPEDVGKMLARNITVSPQKPVDLPCKSDWHYRSDSGLSFR
jgi:hypothetical protein